MRKDYTIIKATVGGLVLGIVLIALLVFAENVSHSNNLPQEPTCPPKISTNFSIEQPKTADELDAPVFMENVTIPHTATEL